MGVEGQRHLHLVGRWVMVMVVGLPVMVRTGWDRSAGARWICTNLESRW